MPAPQGSHPARVQRILSVLDHEVRLRVLAVLFNVEEAKSFRELVEMVGVSDSRLAQHLKPLVQSALVLNKYQRTEGRDYSFYEISELGREWLERVDLVDPSSGQAALVPV